MCCSERASLDSYGPAAGGRCGLSPALHDTLLCPVADCLPPSAAGPRGLAVTPPVGSRALYGGGRATDPAYAIPVLNTTFLRTNGSPVDSESSGFSSDNSVSGGGGGSGASPVTQQPTNPQPAQTTDDAALIELMVRADDTNVGAELVLNVTTTNQCAHRLFLNRLW